MSATLWSLPLPTGLPSIPGSSAADERYAGIAVFSAADGSYDSKSISFAADEHPEEIAISLLADVIFSAADGHSGASVDSQPDHPMLVKAPSVSICPISVVQLLRFT